MNLLIADDETIIRNGLLSLDWSSVGIDEVYSARNGTEARELLLSVPLDIVIFDIRMPGMSGLELAALIREYSMDTAVIILTGFSEFEYAREAMRSGVYEYLLKPFHPREMLEVAKRVKKQLEKERYQLQIMREYEDKKGAYDTLSQLKNAFPRTSALVTDILEDIAARYEEPLSLGGFAEKYHFSGNYISKKIKQETGYGFVELLLAVRVMNAGLLLQAGEKVNQAAEKTGFHDQHHFAQVFRRIFGCSPTDFKKAEDCGKMLRLKYILDKVEKQR